MGALRLRALTKTFAGGRALDDVDLDIGPGEVHALLGENGSGKSTLIKVLAGVYRPDPGSSVEIGGHQLQFGHPAKSYDLGMRFVHQDLGLVEAASIRDNLAYGSGFTTRFGTINAAAARRRTANALAGVDLDFDPDVPVSALSPAQKTGIGVARALLEGEHPVRLLVLDEPTARLPEQEVERLLDIVRSVARSGVAVLYVTHRLDEVFEIADQASVLRDGVKVTTTPVVGLTRDALLQHLLGADLETPHRGDAKNVESTAPALVVSGLSSEALHDVNLTVHPGEIVGIAGITGSGREALCGTIFGGRKRDDGTVHLGGESIPGERPDSAIAAGAAYVPAERKLHGAFLNLSAQENISIANLREIWHRLTLRASAEAEMGRTWFERLGVRPRGATGQVLSSFSGGNQQKVVFAKWFQRTPSLFLLDEPTQGVDVGAKAELHRALFAAAAAGAGVLMSSGDVDELMTTCDRVLVLRGGRVVTELRGAELTPLNMSRAALGIDQPTGKGSAT